MSETITQKPDEAMGSDEFLSRVHDIAEALERMKESDGGYLPDIIMVGDAMERLADRWYRCNVKTQLADLLAARERIAELEKERDQFMVQLSRYHERIAELEKELACDATNPCAALVAVDDKLIRFAEDCGIDISGEGVDLAAVLFMIRSTIDSMRAQLATLQTSASEKQDT